MKSFSRKKKKSQTYTVETAINKKISDDLLRLIFSYLEIKHLRNLFLTCKRWYEACKNNSFWVDLWKNTPTLANEFPAFKRNNHKFSTTEEIKNKFKTYSTYKTQQNVWRKKYKAGFKSQLKNIGFSPDDTKFILIAAKKGQTDIIKFLLDMGIKINRGYEYYKSNLMAYTSCSNMTPLFMAVIKNHEQLVKLLLEHGADCESKVTSYKPGHGSAGGAIFPTTTIQTPIEVASSPVIVTLLKLAAAEKAINTSSRENVEELFEEAAAADSETFRDYIETLIKENKGFSIYFSEDQKNFLLQLNCIKQASEKLTQSKTSFQLL